MLDLQHSLFHHNLFLFELIYDCFLLGHLRLQRPQLFLAIASNGPEPLLGHEKVLLKLPMLFFQLLVPLVLILGLLHHFLHLETLFDND